MRILVLAACLFSLTGAPGLMAQTAGSGAIAGVISDSSGAPAPDVTIVLIAPDTGRQVTVKSDTNGRYRFEGIAPGRYRVRVLRNGAPAAGFREQSVEVGTAGDTTLNLTMSPADGRGSPRTDEAAAGQALMTQTDPAQVRHDFNAQAIQYKPEPNIVNKSGTAYGAYNLAVTSEAVATHGGPARGVAVAGTRPESNNFRIDGIDNNNKVQPGPLVYLSNEATQAFSMAQGQALPVFGHSAGGNFNSNVRTGSNGVHGSLYDYFQNRWLNAMEPSWGRLGLKDNPRYDQNRLGASLGLPILPSKLFAFGNFEYIPLGFERPIGGNAVAPTAAGFAALSRAPGVSITNLGILAGALGSAASARTGTELIAGIPVGLGPVTAMDRGFRNQFTGAGGIDWNIRHSDALHLRYVHNEIEGRSAGISVPIFSTPLDTRALAAGVAHEHTFGANVTNQLRLGYNRWDNRFGSPSSGLADFPNIQIGGTTNLAFGANTSMRDSSVYNTYQLADGVAFNAWGHNFRIGGDALRTISSLGALSNSRGAYVYSSLERFVLDLPPDVLAQRSFGSTALNDNRWLATGYVQDTWNVWPSVTLNLGVRYEYATIPAFIDRQGLLRGTDVNLPGSIFDFRIPPADNNNWAPNAGFAWSPGQNRRSVIRAGFAMQYDLLTNPWVNFGSFAPQVGTTITLTGLSDTPGFLRRGGISNPYPASGNLTSTQTRSLLSAYQGKFTTPYSMQWNFGVQQMLWRNSSLDVRYLGTRNVHLPVLGFANVASPVTARNSLPVYTTVPTQAELNALPLTLNQLAGAPVTTTPGFTNPVFTAAPDGNSIYHGLALDLTQRFGALQVLGTYTWSHLIDDSTGTPLDLTFGRQRTDSLYDRRHRGTITGVLDVAPLFTNRWSPVKSIFANLAISGTYIYQSAARFPVLSNSNAGLTGFGFATPALMNPSVSGMSSSAVTPLRNSAGQIVAYQAVNPNARFIAAAPGVYAPGIRNAFALDPVDNVDISVVKRFSYRDRFAFELRGDAYNLFNSRQFTGVRVNSLDFQSMFFAPSYLVAGNPAFGDPSGFLTSNPRTLQFALRATF